MSVEGEAESGFFSRLRRVFGGGRARAATLALPENPGELGFALTSRAPVLFSVFPRSGEESEAPGEPTQDFGIHLAHALHRRLKRPEAPPLVGLVGAGGAGKSTLFNDLVGAPLSSVDILPHTTRGPLGVAAEGVDVRGLMAPLALEESKTPGKRRGDQTRFVVRSQPAADLGDLAEVVLVDLPDLNTLAAADEGRVTEAVLPWLDATVVVCSVESFDRTVMDGSLDRLRSLGSELALVFNRKGCRGGVAAADRRDLEERARAFGAAGPFFIPDRRQEGQEPDDRVALREWVAGCRHGPEPARRRALRAGTTRLGREALARHEARAERAEAVLDQFKRGLAGLRERVELDPVTVFPDEVGHVVRDLRGLLGSPLEWLRRVMRGQGVVDAFQRTFQVERRLEELEAAVERLRGASPASYVERLEDHFRMVASSVARSYRAAVRDEPTLFVEMECRQDLVDALFVPHRAAAARGFTEYRDQVVGYLDHLREGMLGPSSQLERVLATVVLLFLMVDVFVPGFSFVLYSGGYLATRTLGSELSGFLAEHQRLAHRQRAELERCWDMLASGLEGHFLRGNRYFGRMEIMTRAERDVTRALLERLDTLDPGGEEEPA